MLEIIDYPSGPKDTFYYRDWDYEPWVEVSQKIGDISVYCDGHLNGGGSGYGQEIAYVLKFYYPDRVFDSCLEWCCGAGFIGFKILQSGISRNLYLSDVYRPAIIACDTTISHLPDSYKTRTIKTLHTGDIAEFDPDLQFDLIVSNPPHWDWTIKPFREAFNDHRICADNGWKIHENFFLHIKKHLSPDGVILLQENASASGPDTFRHMIESNGLKIHRCFQTTANRDYWYLEIHHS